MPVSRKRKKPKSRTRPTARQEARGLLAGWQRAAMQRIRVAAEPAGALVAELVPYAAGHAGADLEDELCARLGPLLNDLAGRPDASCVDPESFGVALVMAAATAADRAELAGQDGVAESRVMAATLGIVPRELVEAVQNLTRGAGLPDPVADEVSWARDRYGSRFAVVARFAADRWYLWDIDACTLLPVTVHSGFHTSPGQAFTAWQDGVGPFASAGARWGTVDDPGLLRELLPKVAGIMALGGESVEQHAEYLRSRRLAEVLPGLPAEPAGDAAVGDPEQFVSWRREHLAGPEPAELDDLAAAVAEVWPTVVPGTFSRHRVAHVAGRLRTEFHAEPAERMIALLPDWVAWLAAVAGVPAELVEHALPAARGGSTTDDIGERVVE